MKRIALILGLAAVICSAPAFAQETAPNALKMDGGSDIYDQNVSYGPNAIQFKHLGNHRYDVTVYADPRGGGVETFNPQINEALLMGEFQFDAVRIWLGNLNDKKLRDKMPEGEVDLVNRRVVFRNVPLSGKERLNVPCKFYRRVENGELVEIDLHNQDNPRGKGYGWIWISEVTEASVTGTPDNGYRFEVMPDGSLAPRGKHVLAPQP